MKRVFLFSVLLFIFHNKSHSQNTVELESNYVPSSLILHPYSAALWNNYIVMSGALDYNVGCGFHKLDTVNYYYGFNTREFYFDYPCDKVSGSAALGSDAFVMTGTLSDPPNGQYPKPFVLLADTISFPITAFMVEDSSLSLQVTPKLAATSDGGFVVSWTGGTGEGRIIKCTHTGAVSWSKAFSVSGTFYVDDIASKGDGDILIAGRNPTSQGLDPTLITFDSLGNIVRSKSFPEQQCDPVCLASGMNNNVLAYCVPDPLSSYNKLNLLLLDQNDSLVAGHTYISEYCSYECGDILLDSDTSWIVSGNLFPPPSWPSVGFYFKGSSTVPLQRSSFIGDFVFFTKFHSTISLSSNTLWTAAERGDGSGGLYIKTALPVDDCLNANFYTVTNPYAPTMLSVVINAQSFSPVLVDPHVVGGGVGQESPTYMCVSGINEVKSDASLVTTYPNPATDNISFQFSTPISSGEIIITDNVGREILRRKIDNEQQINFTVADLADGMYYYQLAEKEEIKSSGKFIVQH